MKVALFFSLILFALPSYAAVFDHTGFENLKQVLELDQDSSENLMDLIDTDLDNHYDMSYMGYIYVGTPP